MSFIIVALVAFGSSFLATSLASSQSAELRSDFPAATLPEVQLSDSERLALNNLISIEFGPRVGITSESYDHVHLVGRTSAGPLYLILGTSGACLYLNSAVSCGDPGESPGGLLALLIADQTGTAMVGGGVAEGTVPSVSIDVPKVGRLIKPVAQGAFLVTEADAIPVTRQILFSAED